MPWTKVSLGRPEARPSSEFKRTCDDNTTYHRRLGRVELQTTEKPHEHWLFVKRNFDSANYRQCNHEGCVVIDDGAADLRSHGTIDGIADYQICPLGPTSSRCRSQYQHCNGEYAAAAFRHR
jgi:hypothetical protein